MTTGYADFYAQFDEAIRAGADAATQGGLNYIANLLPYVFVPLVIVWGILFASGDMSKGRFISYATRTALCIWLVVGAMYVPILRDNLVDGIPNGVARAIHGSVDDRMTAVQQFDLIETASANYVANILNAATGWGNIPNKTAVWFARGCMKFILELVFYVWIAMRQAMYLAAAFLALTIVFLPFETLRGLFMSQLHRVMGICGWQICASILLKIMLGGTQIFLKKIATDGTSMSLEMQIDNCFTIAGWFLGMLVLFLSIPTLVGIGSAATASSGIAVGAGLQAGAGMIKAGNALSKAVNKLSKKMGGNNGGGGNGGGGSRARQSGAGINVSMNPRNGGESGGNGGNGNGSAGRLSGP